MGIEPPSSWSPVRLASNWATEASSLYLNKSILLLAELSEKPVDELQTVKTLIRCHNLLVKSMSTPFAQVCLSQNFRVIMVMC